MTIERELTPIERILTWSPFSIVSIAARINGLVTEEMLHAAVQKAQFRHPVLRARMVQDGDRLSFSTDEVGEIPVKIVRRASDQDWIELVQRESQIPFDFEARPAIRFFLVQSPEVSDLVILCHHSICDGLSLAYLAKDLLEFLGDPDRQSEPLPAPAPISTANIPAGVGMSGVVKFFIKRMTKKWQAQKVVFDQQDYQALTEAYWQHFSHSMLTLELDEEQTAGLAARCKAEGVTVNSALTAAAAGAQIPHLRDRHHPVVVAAGSLRGRLDPPVGEGIGFYASAANFKLDYKPELGFWENARRFHKALQPHYEDKKLFSEPLTWLHLDPTYLEAMNFKKLGSLVSPGTSRYEKLNAFANQEDVVSSLLRRGKMEKPDQLFLGTAVTNLTRMDFPIRYGDLELERLYIKAGGAYPLASVNLLLAAVTCSGRLSLTIEYAEEAVDTVTMTAVRDTLQDILLKE